MPIRRELRKFYGPEWQNVTRPRILERAGDRCENCGVPNHAQVLRFWGRWVLLTKARLTRRHVTAFWNDPNSQRSAKLATIPIHLCRGVHIVLTIAHLNHTPGDDRDENLKALCQWCHLNWDRLHHLESRTARKDAARPLLVLTQEVS